MVPKRLAIEKTVSPRWTVYVVDAEGGGGRVGDAAAEGGGFPGAVVGAGVTVGIGVGADVGDEDAVAEMTPPPGDRVGSATALVHAAIDRTATSRTPPARRTPGRMGNLIRVVAEIRGRYRRQ